MMDPVQHQLDAYNRRDLDRFLEAYAADIVITGSSGATLLKGLEAMSSLYGSIFRNSPALHCNVVKRIRVGNWVVDEEQVSGLNAEGFPSEVDAAVVYQVKDGKITSVWILM